MLTEGFLCPEKHSVERLPLSLPSTHQTTSQPSSHILWPFQRMKDRQEQHSSIPLPKATDPLPTPTALSPGSRNHSDPDKTRDPSSPQPKGAVPHPVDFLSPCSPPCKYLFVKPSSITPLHGTFPFPLRPWLMKSLVSRMDPEEHNSHVRFKDGTAHILEMHRHEWTPHQRERGCGSPIKYSSVILAQITPSSCIGEMQMEGKTSVDGVAWLCWQWLQVCGVGCLLWQPRRPDTEKGQTEGPKWPTQNTGGDPRVPQGSLEGVTDVLLGRYSQGLIIRVTRWQTCSQLYFNSTRFLILSTRCKRWDPDSQAGAFEQTQTWLPHHLRTIPHPSCGLHPSPWSEFYPRIAQMETDTAWYRRRGPVGQKGHGNQQESMQHLSKEVLRALGGDG